MSPRYSSRLGAIDDSQFAAVACKAGLGEFVSAAPVPNGLFGQNVFLTTSTGDYVFRGAPHCYRGRPDDAWQFPKERFYAGLLHDRTGVPVAWPQRLDDSCETFPWPYLIAPRLPGLCLADPAARADLGPEDLMQVARAMGETLAGLQALAWDVAGDFDPETQGVTPYAGGYHGHLAREIGDHAEAARRNGRLTPDDQAWLDSLIAADAAAGSEVAATFAHNDYHWGNLLVERAADRWRVSGVIDLMTACFGDPAADLVRACCAWFDEGAPERAQAYLDGYRKAGGAAAPTPERLAVLTAYERLMIWAYFTRPGVGEPEAWRGLTYRSWTERYLRRLARAWFGETA